MDLRSHLAGASATPPAAPSSPSVGFPSAGTPGTDPATQPGPYWFHQVAEEFRAIQLAAGQTPNQGTLNQVVSAIQQLIANGSAPVTANFKKLQASASGLSAAVLVSADEVVVSSATPASRTLKAVSLSIAGTAVGANGLDAGLLASSTWYSVWVIWNGTTTAGLLSLSATAPTLPGGYTYKARVGWIKTDSSGNMYPISFKQDDENVEYVVAAGSNLTTPVAVASGVAGDINAPTWVAITSFRSTASNNGLVPPTARAANVVSWADAVGTAMVSPSNAYGAYNSAANAPPLVTTGTSSRTPYELHLETSNIYYASDRPSAGVYVMGWKDSL